MCLHTELTNLGLRASELEGLDHERFWSIVGRNVGPICLYGLRDLVNQSLDAEGYSERVTPDKFRSMYSPAMMEVPLVKFCEGTRFQPKDRHILDQAIKSVQKKFCQGRTSPISLEEAELRLLQDKSDHFAGLPTLGKKEADTHALERAKQCWVGKCPPPAILLHRGKNTEVVRVVWGFPFEWHIVEASFYYPLFQIISKRQSVYPVGKLSTRRYHLRQFDSLQGMKTKFGLDYSGFDASINPQLIGIAFGVLRSMLDLNEAQGKVFDRIQTYFATSPFLAPDGLVYSGRRGGVPSGSMFTQMIDSIVNAIAIEYAMRMLGERNYRYMVYGDDSWLITSVEAPRAQEFLKRYQTHVESLGLKLNLEKTDIASPGTPLVFCGHYDIMRGRPLQDAIDKLVYPERPSEAYASGEGIAERVVAYMADSDAPVLNLVYLALTTKASPYEIVNRGFHANLTNVMDVGLHIHNSRHLPGILQVAISDPKTASTLMKVRSAT